MKKITLIMAAIFMTVAAGAKILRVSNVSGSSAPYSTIKAAHDAAAVGDTIIVDGSAINYGDVTLSKKVVLIGPGYWLVANGIMEEGAMAAEIERLQITAAETVVKGMCINNDLVIDNADKVIVTRCYINRYFTLDVSNNCVIHQNYIAMYGVRNGSYMQASKFAQITNNIIRGADIGGDITGLDNSYIANNSFINGHKFSEPTFSYLSNCTIENNILFDNEGLSMNGCTFKNNFLYSTKDYYSLGSYSQYTDAQCKADELKFSQGKYGAFSGDDPYVISGIAPGPVIQDITVPTTVEKGSKMNVTIKVGIQK